MGGRDTMSAFAGKGKMHRWKGSSVAAHARRTLIAFALVAAVFSVSTFTRLQVIEGELEEVRVGGDAERMGAVGYEAFVPEPTDDVVVDVAKGDDPRSRATSRHEDLQEEEEVEDLAWDDPEEDPRGKEPQADEKTNPDDRHECEWEEPKLKDESESIGVEEEDDALDDDGDEVTAEEVVENVVKVDSKTEAKAREAEVRDPAPPVAEERERAIENHSDLDKETGLSNKFLAEYESIGEIEDYLKETKVDYSNLDTSREDNHKIEQAFATAHWKEWQNTEKGVDEYYKLNVLFDDTEEEEKVGWKKTMIRIPPSKRRAPPPRSRRRRSRDQGTSGGGGGGTTTREVDGNRKILLVKLPCDEKVLRGLSRKERAKTGCFGGGGGGGSGGGGGRRTSRSSRRGSGAGGSKTS